MAKQVSEILVKLGIQGLEGLDKLKSSFRELEKSLGPSATTIERARESIIAFGREGRNTEQVLKGQIEALRGLQSQTERGSVAWAELAADIEKFRQASRRTDDEIEILRQSILSVATGANQSQQSLRSYIADLGRLRNEATITGSVFSALGSDIAELTVRLQQAESQTTQTGRAFGRVLGQALASTSAGAQKQIQELGTLINEQRGLIDSIDARSSRERKLKKYIEERAEAEDKLNRALAQRRQATYQESARTGRETARSAAVAFADPEFLRSITPEALNKRLGELPNTTAGLNQQLSELSERLANTKRNTVDYLVVAMQMAGVQRELTAVTQGYAQALLMGIRTGTVAPSARNLQEVITALRAEMSQLDMTTSEGARAYAENASQARALEQQLKGLANAYRHVGDMATEAATAQASEATARVTANYLNRSLIRQQEQAMAELGQRVRAGVAATPLALPAAGQTTAPGTGLEISGGARAGRATGRIQRFFARFDVGDAQLQMPGQPVGYGPKATEEQADRARRAAISEADAVRTAGEARARAEQQVQSYRAEIDIARRADIGSIESTQRLRDAINQYRSTLPGAGTEFKKLTKDISDLDARSEKLGRGLARRRMGGMQVAQAAGAALSGGIFGGPEGFLGGALGGVFGGVGGAFAGAAAGAQVGTFRQQLGGFADYAAQIQKMQIALRNAAGSQDQFNQAVAAANFAVRNLNVPQDVAIQGMTRLTAAVKGAGGQVTDAELVFKNVTSAIKATGGSAEDVDGAITAMVQVFSKGKVSAEELSGQLGERLPGAVTKFAKANDMTLPELQKALEQGQVGLNELMNFIVQLGDEYSGVAEKIAGSSQDAGARLTVAFNDMRIAIGETLQPVGAQFQEAFADFIVNITPGLVAAAKAVGDGIKFIIDNASQIGAIVEFAVKLGGVTLALKALQAMQGPIGTLFLALQSGFQATSAQAVIAQGKIIAFGTTVKTIAASLAAPVVVTFAIVGAQLVIQWLQRIKKARQDLINLKKDATGEEWFTNIGGKALPENQLKKAINEVGQAYAEAADNVIRLKKERDALEAKGPTQLGSTAIATAARLTEVKAALAAEEQRALLLSNRYQAGIRNLPNAPKGAQGAVLTQFPDLAQDGAKSEANKEAEKAAKEAERARQEMLKQLKAAQDLNFEQKNRLDILRQEEPFAKAFTEFAVRRAEIERRYNDLLKASKSEEERSNLQQARAAEYKQSSLSLQKEINQLTEKAAAPIVETVNKIKEKIEYDREYARLLKEGVTPELAQQLIEINKAYNESVKALEPAVEAAKAAILKAEAEGASATEIKKYREELEKIQQLPGQKKAEGEKESKEEADRKKREADAEEQAERLRNLYRGIVNTIEDGIVGSFMAGIDSLISGTKTLGEALQEIASGVLKDIGQMLLRFAVNLGMRAAFPGAFAAKGAYFSSGQADFAQNSIKPFAMGGIVTKPTFFKFANGGTMSNGVMGEAGPEAIMPLKRGADGKLGVAARLDGAMKRYRATPGSAAAAAEGDAASLAAVGAATMEPIDVRYSVERINNVDYVTADQFQRGMAQAAQQGAIQGERRAMRSLKNSSATRRGVGL